MRAAHRRLVHATVAWPARPPGPHGHWHVPSVVGPRSTVPAVARAHGRSGRRSPGPTAARLLYAPGFAPSGVPAGGVERRRASMHGSDRTDRSKREAEGHQRQRTGRRRPGRRPPRDTTAVGSTAADSSGGGRRRRTRRRGGGHRYSACARGTSAHLTAAVSHRSANGSGRLAWADIA